jgi:hypothetical protein
MLLTKRGNPRDDSVDEDAGRSKVQGRVGEPIDIGVRQVRPQFGVAAKN